MNKEALKCSTMWSTHVRPSIRTQKGCMIDIVYRCLCKYHLLKLLWFKNFLLLQILTRVLYITWAIHSKQLDILHWNEHWSAHNFPCQVAKSPVEHLRHLRRCFSHPIEKYAHQNASQSSSILRVKLQINNLKLRPWPSSDMEIA